MKSVLVTGCSSGIGLCIADGLKTRGYNVITTARKHEDIDALIKSGFECIMLDLNDSNSIQQAAAVVLDKTNGKLYGLVNNAAYGVSGAVEDLSRDVLTKQFDTNVFGTHELTSLLLSAMRKNNEGRIIQISSVLGFVTMKYRGAYCASKHALESLSDAMRYEIADTNIKISLIEPGPIKSEFRNNALANFHGNIDKEKSVHKEAYAKIERDMDGKNYKVPFTLGPEAVFAKVIHALESNRPRARYCVTFPTYLFAVLKRILPNSLLDKILCRV